MKKLIRTALAAALLVPTALAAQNISTTTYFEGESISGVDASSAFEVVLVKSINTKAVVEISQGFESSVRISRSSNGVVSIDIDGTKNLWSKFNRLANRDRVIRLTLHLPSLNIVRLSGASSLSADDSFTGENVDIIVSGASKVKHLNIASQHVKLDCGGASGIAIILPSTRNLEAFSSGASHIGIRATNLAYSKFDVSGASGIEIDGSGTNGDWEASGAAHIDGEGFPTRELTVSVSGASSAKVNVSDTLNANTSSASTIRYVGRPASINSRNNSIRPL
jgi:hypothetical protein